MARRKGISSNTSKNKPVSVALHSVQQFTPVQDEIQTISKKNNNLHSENSQLPVPSQEKNHFEFTINNNDHKYLHKKFKKMASAVAHQDDPNQPNVLQSTSQNVLKISSPNRTDTFSNHIKYSNILIDRELENNVQIKFKNVETSDDYNLNMVSECNEANSRDIKLSEKTDHIEVDTHNTKDSMNGTGSGRYVCPYCKLSCAKPSVLQKHIRAHTNERPYPCSPCGFAFKTKSNLYKHCRSRAHNLRLQGTEIPPSANDDDWSLGSESDVSLSATSLSENSLKSTNENSSPEMYQNERASPTTTHSSSTSQTEFKPKSIYKPKFHKASLYQENDGVTKNDLSARADFLNQHISKIISDNEAVVDTLDSPLHKKFSKLSTMLKPIGETSKTASPETQPLNLTKEMSECDSNMRKRCYSESFAHQEIQKAPQHPLNPEGSIIKDLLLKARAQATGLLPVTSEDYDGTETLYGCPLCQISFRSADNLEIHRLYYCKGNRSGTASPSRDLVKLYKPENILLRSNSIHVTLPETYNPNTLAKLATSTLKSPLPKTGKPDDLIIKPDCSDIATPLPSPGPLLGHTRLVDSKYSDTSKSFRMLDNSRKIAKSGQDTIDDILSRSELYSPPSKMRCLENNPTTLRSLEELSLSPMRPSSSSLQMFGGEVKILDNSGATTTLRIEPTRSQLSPTSVPQSISSPKSETSNIVVRSGLHSGGTMMHNPPTPKEVMPSPLPQTPRLKVSIAPNISTPNLSVAGIPAPNMTHFQFPPIGSITAYNPLTLPPLSPIPSPNGASTILHGGKLIPYVPGMPGPNTPTSYLPSHKISLKYSPILEPDFTIKEGRQIRPIEKAAPKIQIVKQESSLRRIKMKSPERSHTINIPSIVINSGETGHVKNGVILPYSIQQNDIKMDEPSKNSSQNNEIRHFNFENLISKSEIVNKSVANRQTTAPADQASTSPKPERSETSYFKKNTSSTATGFVDQKTKFLRPSSLPLKPGTFVPKKHHGITPNANTLPLISPETPRPAKAYGQLYLNGHAYTYLGLKCSTKVYFCTLNRPQPTYVPNQHSLSMYSNWQVCSEATPHPLGLTPCKAMSLYDSRHHTHNISIAKMKRELIITHSSQWGNNKEPSELSGQDDADMNEQKADNTPNKNKDLTGGFESNEEYIYVRGRGRGRYVCSECGIRCKKPSMLKKHIRTHTDVRPYTCKHCAFSFKTKGNLTKHMKSKSHYQKCRDLGINPLEEIEANDACQGGESDEGSDSDGDDGNEGETESSDTDSWKSRMPEHEAAQSLLSLWEGGSSAVITPGLITSARPTTYPYAPQQIEDSSLAAPHSESAESFKEPMMDREEPMDLSKGDGRMHFVSEHSVIASLALSAAKLPQSQSHWPNGEPMLHAYLTEKALRDAKIKQSQYTLRKLESNPENDGMIYERRDFMFENATDVTRPDFNTVTMEENACFVSQALISQPVYSDSRGNENAKFVASEYLKMTSNKSNDCSDGAERMEDNCDIIEKSDPEKQKFSEHTGPARKVVVGAGGVSFKVCNMSGEFSSNSSFSTGRLTEDGRSVCVACNKSFSKPSQLRLHINIHYMERPFRCSACAVSFRTRGHLQKHERSGSHHNKVSMTSTFGAATSANPRPFKCSDCKIAFRIHGHLAKHLRSKMHVMRLECLGKLPFGTFAEIERAGVSLTDIDTTDCDNSLASLQILAQKLHEKDPTKLESWDPATMVPPLLPAGRESSDEEDNSALDKCENDKSVYKRTENSDKFQSQYGATDT